MAKSSVPDKLTEIVEKVWECLLETPLKLAQRIDHIIPIPPSFNKLNTKTNP